MALPPIMRTTAARLSALYLLLFAACAVALVFYMTSLSARMLTAQTQETINEEVQGLALAYQRGGLPLLARTVEARSRQPGANLYLIAHTDGRILSGNVESLEAGVLDVDGWTNRPFAYERYGEGTNERRRLQEAQGRVANEPSHQAIALVLRLPNRMIMLVGRDLGEPERFRVVVQRALMVALAMMALGGLLIWYFVGRSALRRIDTVSEASRRIMGGDLGGRLPVTGTGDEFDRLSENLNAMLSRIADLNEGLKQVSDNIAHDLKTPLTRLRNRAEAALAADNAADHREALEGTIAESDQLIRTFNAILMISRLEAGYSAESLAKVDLHSVVRDVADLYEPASEEMGVTLIAETPRDAVVDGNRELIAQALSNIVDNAIKYTARHSEKPCVRILLDADRGGEARIAVTDNGPGIPDEADRQRATERFVRLEQSRSRPGSGLGLSLAKAVMKFHGGGLELLPANPGLSVVLSFAGAKAAT